VGPVFLRFHFLPPQVSSETPSLAEAPALALPLRAFFFFFLFLLLFLSAASTSDSPNEASAARPSAPRERMASRRSPDEVAICRVAASKWVIAPGGALISRCSCCVILTIA
jgi:hypothetical protein